MADRKTSMDTLGVSVLIGFNIVLGLNQALVKVVNAGFSPVFQAGLRSVCAFLPVMCFALVMRKRLSILDGTLALGLLNGMLFSIEFCLLFLALDYTSVGRASLFFYTMPFWVAIGAHFLVDGERLDGRRILGLGVALAGVSLVLLWDKDTGSETAWKGDLLALAAAMAWAGIALLTRTTKLSTTTPEMNLLYQLGVSAVVLLALTPLFGEAVREPTWTIMWVFTFQVIVVVSIGFLIWFWVLSIYPVSNMASFSLLAPVAGVFFGAVIFDEKITATFVIALVMVGLGILMINRVPRLRG